MPDLSKVKVTSPLRDFKEPITSRAGSTIGSADTAIGRFGLGLGFHTFYDKSFAGYENQQNERYANQNIPNAIGNFAADLGVKTISGLPALVGSVAGVGQGIGSVATGGSFMEGFNDNPLLNMAEAMNHWGSENFPHMLEKDYHDRTFLQQLNPLVSGGQILTSNVETIGFLAQSFGLAGIIGKVGLGARLAPKLSKVKNFKEALSVLEAPNLAKLASNIDDVALNAFLTTNEAAMEGLEARRTAIDKLRQARIDGENNYTDQQIEGLSNSSQNNVFWANMLTLGATNYAFGKLVKPLFSPQAVSTRANAWALKKATSNGDLVESSAKRMTPFEKFLFDEGHAAGMATKALATQFVTEGAEESLQMSVQNVNNIDNGRKDFLSSFGESLKDFALHGFDLTDKERAKSFGLGALIGAGSTAVMSFSKHGVFKTAKSFREAQDRYVQELNKAYTDFNDNSLVAKDPDQKGKVFTKKDEATGQDRFFVESEDKVAEVSQKTYQQYVDTYQPDADGNFVIKGQIQLDENGAPIKDMAKMADLAASMKYHQALDNLIDIEASRGKPDETKISLYKKYKIKELALKAFDSGTTELLYDKLDEYKTLDDQKLVEAGYNDRRELEQEIDSLKDFVSRLEKNYLSTQNGIVAPINISSEEEHKLFRRSATELGMNIVAMDALISEIDTKLGNLNVDNPELANRIADIRRVFSSKEIDEIFPYTTEMSTEPIQREVAQLVEKRKELVRVREALGESYTKYLDPAQGYKTWKKDKKSLKPALTYRSKLFLNDKLTEQDFDDYVGGEMVYERTKDANKRATSVFYADAINTFIKYLTPEGFTSNAAESLTKLVQDVIDKEVQLYPDEAEKLKDYINTMHSEHIRAKEALEKRAVELGVDLEMLDYIELDEASEEERLLIANYDELNDIYIKLTPIITDIPTIEEKIDNLTSMNFDLSTDSDLLEGVMKRLFYPFTSLRTTSGFDGEKVNDDFTDVGRTAQALKGAEALYKVLNAKSKKDKDYVEFSRSLGNLVSDLKEILKQAKQNASNREIREAKENEMYAQAFDTVTNLFEFDKTDYNKLYKASPVLASIAAPHLIKNKVKDPQLVIDTLRSKAFDLISGLKIFSDEVVSKSFMAKALTEAERKAAIFNTTKAFTTVWKTLLDNEKSVRGEAVNLQPLEQFLVDYDIVGFASRIDEFAGVTKPEELRQLLDTQLQLLALLQIESINNSTFSDVDYIDTLIKSLESDKGDLVPSAGQLRVIRELSVFFQGPFNTRNELFDNVAALKAPAGAGKSMVVAKFFKMLNSLKDNEIYTAAPMQLAAANIASSVGSTHGVNTVDTLIENLAKDTLPKQTRLIILDEAGAVTIEQYYYLAAELAKYNVRNPDSVVRMLMLYDPNQVTEGNAGSASLDALGYYEISTAERSYWEGNEAEKKAYRSGNKIPEDKPRVPFVHNITQITPLSTTYRSDVVEIADLQNTFKTNNTVGEVSSSASKAPSGDVTDITGTYAEKGSTIVDTFLRSQKQNPHRSRSVVVGSEAKKQEYLRLLPGAEVITVKEAQGITRDEVYVDITTGDHPYFADSPRTFNQFVYTALSRAVVYLHMANAPTPEFVPDPSVITRAEELKASKENIKAKRVESLKSDKDTLKNLLGEVEKVKVKPTPIATVEEAKDAVEELEEEIDTQDEPYDSPAPLDEVREGFHALRRPSSNAFKEDPLFEPVKAGMQLTIAKDISNDKLRYLILQDSVADETDTRGLRVVGILEESEVPEFESATGLDLQKLPGYNFTKDYRFGNNGVDPGEPMTGYGLYVGASSSDIQYVYHPQATYSFKEHVDEEGVITALPLLERHLKTMYGPDPREHLEDYDEVIENFHKYAKIISYSTQKQIELDFAQGRNPKDIDKKTLPKKNLPYLVIENIKLKNSTKPLAKQFIKLETDVIDTNDAYMAPMFSFLTKMEEFEGMLSRANLPGKYSALKNGFGIQMDSLNTYYPFHFFVTQLSDAYQALQLGKDFTVKMAEEQHLTTMFPDMDAKSIPSELLKLAYELDVLVHGQVEEGQKRRYKGEAQQLMDSIGAQNLLTTTASGLNVLLRDYRVAGFDEAREITEAAGVSLMGPIRWRFNKGRSANPLIKDKLKAKLRAYQQKLADRGQKESSRYKFIDGILNPATTQHLQPITTATLRDLFSGSADSNGRLTLASEGFGLRRPIKKDVNARIDYGQVVSPSILEVDASYFTSTFDRVIPTRITVSASSSASESTPALDTPEKAVTPITALKREISSGATITASEETKGDFTRLMDTETFEEAVDKYLQRSNEGTTYTFSAKSIAGAMREFFTDRGFSDIKDLIEDEWRTSLNVVGTGSYRNTTAARDFIRSTVIARMFPGINYSNVRKITDLAREYYDLNKPGDVAAFDTALEQLEFETRQSGEGLQHRLDALKGIAESLLQDVGVTPEQADKKFRDKYPEADLESTLGKVQRIVMYSSFYRDRLRAESTPPLVIEGFEEFLRTVVEAGDDVDLYTDVVNDPANAEFMKRLGATEEDAFDKASEALNNISNERSFRYSESSDIGELMTDSEVSDLLDKLYPASYARYIDFLQRKGKGEQRRFVAFNVLQNSKGEKVWGLYKNGLMSFVRHSSGKIGKRIVLHEFFHKVFWEFLTHGERMHLLSLAQEKWGNLSTEALEEKLADDFMNYAPKPEPNIFARFWEFIKRLLGFSRSYLPSIEAYFDGIYQRKFSPTGEVPEVERSMMNILAKYDSLDQYFLAKKVIMEVYQKILDGRKTDKVLSLQEAGAKVFDEITKLSKDASALTNNEVEKQLIEEALAKTVAKRTALAWQSFMFPQVSIKDALKAIQKESRELIENLEKEIAQAEEERNALPTDVSQDELDAITDKIDDLQDQLEEANIQAETFESELRDPKVKLTGAVKQRLMTITYTKNGKTAFGEIDRIYSVLMGKLASLPTTSLLESLKLMQAQFARYRGGVGGVKNIDQATGRFMYDTVGRVLNGLTNDKLVPKNVSFRKDANLKGTYAIVSKDGSNTHGVTRHQALQNPAKYTLIDQEVGTTTDNFINRIQGQSSLTKSELAAAYFFFEDLDFIRSLMSAVSSLQQSNPHVALQWWDYGKYRSTFYKVKMSGGVSALQGKITTALTDYALSRTGDELFSTDLIANVQRASRGTKSEQAATLKEFLDTIGFKTTKRVLDAADENAYSKLFESMAPALMSMSEKFGVGIDSFENEAAWKAARSGPTLLAEETNFLSDLGLVLNSHYGLSDNNSYTRGDGKKAYGYRDESYQSAVLTAISRAAFGLAHRKFNTFNIEGARLSTQDRFLSSNVIFNRPGHVRGFIDYDSKKTRQNSRFAKYLRKETLADFRERHFAFGFLTRLRQSKAGTYFQFLPIPSNRTSIQAVEMKAFKAGEIDAELLRIIRAQKNRPDPSKNPDLAANKTYNSLMEVTTRDKDGNTVVEKVPNYKLWKLAGLEGSVDKMSEKQALAAVKAHINSKVEEMLPALLYNDYRKKNTVNISDLDLRFAAKFFELGVEVNTRLTSRSTDEEKAAGLRAKNEAITKLLPIFYANFVINQYSASQLVYGDESFYRGKEDQTKRIQVATATGDTLLSDDTYGLPARTKILVIKDLSKEVPTDLKGVLDNSYRDAYDATDAEGFILPEYYERIALTYGIESMTDVVLKPVYFGIENGIPTAVKYSVKVLTDDLVKAYPHLGKLRDAMRASGAHQATFASAVKVGATKKLAVMNDSGVIDPTSISEESILDVDSNLLRFQLNPAKSPEVTTRNPSQLTAFMNTNGKNQSEIWDLHKLNARKIENGRRKKNRELRLTQKGTLSGKAKKAIRGWIKSSTEGLAGALDLHRLISYRKGKDEVSLDLPLIADRAVAALSSMYSDSTVGFRFAGSKLVLQADIGEHKVFGESTPRPLKWKDENGYTEVILPSTYAPFVKEGELFVPGNENGLVGFRIPSTNYHSGIVMKVAGFYPVPKGAKGNVIIAPSLIVYYHGSDNDVDTLFVMRKEAWTKDTVNLNDVIRKYDPEHVDDPSLVLEKDKTIPGFTSEGRVFIGDFPMEEYMQDVIIKLYQSLETATKELSSKNTSKIREKELEEHIQSLNSDFELITDFVDSVINNSIVDLFSTNMLDEKNRKDLLTPISFARVSSVKAKTQQELSALLESDDFLQELSDAGLIEFKCEDV